MNIFKSLLIYLLLISINSYSYAFDTEQICLAKNIYFEAGNQPLAGRLAVAHVVLNRVEDKKFPNSICEVIYQADWHENWKGNIVPLLGKCQFSWFCDGKSDKPTDLKTWNESLEIAYNFSHTRPLDITEGALWYHADYVKPYWSKDLQHIVTIENHLFYK